VDPRAVLDAVVKRKIPIPRRESNPRTPIVQPVAQRYADWAITALLIAYWTNQSEARDRLNSQPILSLMVYGYKLRKKFLTAMKI
jgi:hypothetical protein